MEELARRMTDEQIFAVSHYFSSLPPPAQDRSGISQELSIHSSSNDP